MSIVEEEYSDEVSMSSLSPSPSVISKNPALVSVENNGGGEWKRSRRKERASQHYETNTIGFTVLEMGAERYVKAEQLIQKVYEVITTNPFETELVQSLIKSCNDWIERQKVEAQAMANRNAKKAMERKRENKEGDSSRIGEGDDGVTTITKLQFLEQELALLRKQMQELTKASVNNGRDNGGSMPSITEALSYSCEPNMDSSFKTEHEVVGRLSPLSCNSFSHSQLSETPKLPENVAREIAGGRGNLKKVERRSPGGTPLFQQRPSTFEGGIENALKAAMLHKFKYARDSLSPTSAKKEIMMMNALNTPPHGEKEREKKKININSGAWNKSRKVYYYYYLYLLFFN